MAAALASQSVQAGAGLAAGLTPAAIVETKAAEALRQDSGGRAKSQGCETGQPVLPDIIAGDKA
jgi:hypothetical protein